MKKLQNYFKNRYFTLKQRNQSLTIPNLVKYLLLLSMSLVVLEAKIIKLTPQQQKDWQIKTATPKLSNSLSLGGFMSEVVTPPQYLHTISLPFESQVKKLFVANYDWIKKGQLLAEVTGREWIEIQQKFIADTIELRHHAEVAHRKQKLCSEGIIPKKECLSADAEHQADKIKVSASKTLLKGYGASNKMIDELFQELKISQTIKVKSSISGTLLHLNIRAGKSTSPSDALFVIQKKGALWLEADIFIQKAMSLKKNQAVQIIFHSQKIKSKVLLHSPTINPENQTQKVRFSLPHSPKFLSGMRDTATISITQNTLKVAKKSIINHEGAEILFLKTAKGYNSSSITILGEDRDYYYILDKPKLRNPIAISSVAILKSLMESDDE